MKYNMRVFFPNIIVTAMLVYYLVTKTYSGPLKYICPTVKFYVVFNALSAYQVGLIQCFQNLHKLHSKIKNDGWIEVEKYNINVYYIG